jgi:glycosyltransferase involved in cell wall biosynthesis
VVDDGSQDRTAEEAALAGARVLRHLRNRGYGAALKTGIVAAKYEASAITDADGTYPADQIPAMLRKLDTADMVVGARTGETVNIPFIRKPGKLALLQIMLMPTNHQIYTDPVEKEKYRAKYKIDSLEYADDWVEQRARANGINVLRMTKQLEEEFRRAGKYLAGFDNTAPNEGHLNELGHAVVARELVQAICALATAHPMN